MLNSPLCRHLPKKCFTCMLSLVGDFSESEPQRMNFSLLQDAFPDSGLCVKKQKQKQKAKQTKSPKPFKAFAISETE